MGSPGKTTVSRKPPESLRSPVLVAKAFVSAASNAAAWRGFFEKGFLVCSFQVAGAVCLSCRWPAWRLSGLFGGAGWF